MPSSYPDDSQTGTIYLIHYSAPTTAGRQHYLGWSADVNRRYTQHRSGHGAQQTRKAVREGLKLTLAQTWAGTPQQERELKQAHRREKRGFASLCPFCEEQGETPGVPRGLGLATLRIRHVRASAG